MAGEVPFEHLVRIQVSPNLEKRQTIVTAIIQVSTSEPIDDAKLQVALNPKLAMREVAERVRKNLSDYMRACAKLGPAEGESL